MKSFKEFLNESTDFRLNKLSMDFWWKLVQKARDKYNIHFDMENWDFSKEKGKSYKSKDGKNFIYRMAWSSGDWETPTILFCCQGLDNFEGYSSKDFGCFIYIPDDKHGNPQLIPMEKGGLKPLDDQDKIRANPELGEKSLKEYLDTL